MRRTTPLLLLVLAGGGVSCGDAEPGATGDTIAPVQSTAPVRSAPLSSASSAVDAPSTPPPSTAATPATLPAAPVDEVVLVTAAGDLRIAEPLSGFELTAAPERHSIDGLDTQNVRFERINEDGFFESYSIAVLSGPEVAATLKAPESMEYVAVEAFTVNGSQVYSRHRDFGTEFPIYEFAWGISDHEAVAVLTQYLDEDELLKVVASLEVAR